MSDCDAFIVDGETRKSDFVVLCDHASNAVPADIGDASLGLAKQEMTRHIAYDIGAEAVARKMAAYLDGAVALSTFSRLVIDPNRSERDPTLIREIYDGALIPANRRLSKAAREHRITHYYRPYREVGAKIIDEKNDPVVISVHSFTPKLKNGALRPWEIGILFAHDKRVSDPLLAELSKDQTLTIGQNEPYDGALPGDTMDALCLQKKHKHVLIEIRNDLIEDEAGQSHWAERLSNAILRLNYSEMG